MGNDNRKNDFSDLESVLTPEEEEREKQEWIAARMREDEEEEARRSQERGRSHKSSDRAHSRRVRKMERSKAAAVRRKSAGRRIKIALLVILIVVALIGAGIGYAGYRVTNSGTNLPNLYLNGIPVGGLTKEETLSKLQEQNWEDQNALLLTVKLPAGVSFTLDRRDAGLVMTAEQAADQAARYGHDDNLIQNLLRYVQSRITPVDLASGTRELNESYVRSAMDVALKEFQEKTDGERYTIDEEAKELHLYKGAGEVKIDPDLLFPQISGALYGEERELVFNTISSNPTMPDFQALYDQLNVEPQDAHFAEDGVEIIPESFGCTFDVEAARKLWEAASPMDEIVIPLEILEPAVTAEMLETALFRDCLGTQTTEYKSSSDARINNINLAASKINGVILMPGETFSYNETVGRRTAEAGFQEAPAYANGEVVQELGGGICQVSSTLYCAALYSQMKIVYRESHYFRVTYLPWGQDATVSFPNPDFKFRNDRNYPVKIVAECNNDSKELTISIWGTDEDGSYVTLDVGRYAIGDTILPDVIVGWNVYLFIHHYDADGNLIRTEEGSASTYHKHEWEIEWPGGVNPHKEGDPEEDPDDTGETGGDQPGVVIPGDEPGTGGETGGQTGGETGGQTGGETGGQTGGQTGGETGSQTGGETGGQTGGETGGDAGVVIEE